jgi:hypothetical protein
MPAIYTVAVLAGQYRATIRKTLTHSLADGSETTLCGRINADNTTEALSAHAAPTCTVCARRDPRNASGPFVLRSMLQVSR